VRSDGPARRASTRRDRQLAEVRLLVEQGDERRAAGLAAEHVREFPQDAGVLGAVTGWFDRRTDDYAVTEEHAS
jgi:hypothetical protein